MMFIKLKAVKNRFGVVVWRWNQLVPALGCFLVMLTNSTGFPTGDSELGLQPFSRGVLTVKEAVDHTKAFFSGTSPNAQVFSTAGSESAAPQFRVSVALTANNELISLSEESKSKGVDPVSLSTMSVPSRMPEEISAFDSEDRKKLFIDVVLPTIMVALDEVRQERQQLLAIIAELGADPAELLFSAVQKDWQQRLGGDKAKFILGLTCKYRTESAEELVAMVNVLPPSLVIAQGALESAWGASRFALEENNLFGMYAKESALPKSVDGSRVPKILEYDTILDSVRAYVLNINRLSAYKELRKIRSQTLDPILIAEGLTQYSERKEYYVADVKHIIKRNKLQDYDALIYDAV